MTYLRYVFNIPNRFFFFELEPGNYMTISYLLLWSVGLVR